MIRREEKVSLAHLSASLLPHTSLFRSSCAIDGLSFPVALCKRRNEQTNDHSAHFLDGGCG